MKLKTPRKPKAPAAPIIKSFNPIVSSHGYSDAQILFLQGYPLKEDILQGKALASAESTIKYFLQQNRTDINRTYRSVYIREKLEYSGTNPKRLRTALSKVDLTQYDKMLFDEIKEIKPNVIVPLDDIAIASVFPHVNSIHKPKGRKYWLDCYRGSILPLREDWQKAIGEENVTRIIPTFGVNHLYANYTARSYVSIDYGRIIENSHKRSKIEKPGIVWVAKNIEALRTFLIRQYSKSPTRVTFDIESYGSFPTCISICFDGIEACTVPLLDPTIPSGELAFLWRAVAIVLQDPLLEKNNQNIKYDWSILERFGFILNNVRSDTMIKGKLLYPELPAGLDFWTSIYTEVPYYKDEGKEYNPKLHTRDRLYLYCGYDSLTAHQISVAQDIELEESGMKELYETEYAPSILIYKDMDQTGLLVDEQQKAKLRNKYLNYYDINLKELCMLVGNQKFNPRSNPQVGELLYETLKFPRRVKTDPETGRQSYQTGKEVLDDLLINHGQNNTAGKVGYEIISRTIVCRKLGKIVEYIDTPLYPDGTFRGTSNIAGAETGRTTSSKSIDERLKFDYELTGKSGEKAIKRLGRSLQTITKHGFVLDQEIFDDFESKQIAEDIRSMFVPRRNHVFVEGDGKAAEARVVFVLAEDYDALAACDQTPSLHARTIGQILKIDPYTITKKTPAVPKINVPYYELGKRIRHAGHNGMKAYRLSLYIHMELSYCEMLMNEFHNNNPKIRLNFHNPVTEIIRQTRTLISPNGRKRTFFGKMDDHLINESWSHIQQGIVSDQTKFTMWRIKEELPDEYYTKYRFLTEQHDGILAEVHKDIRDKYIEVFKRIYERPIDFNNCSLSRDFILVIPAEIQWSDTNWLEMKDI